MKTENTRFQTKKAPKPKFQIASIPQENYHKFIEIYI